MRFVEGLPCVNLIHEKLLHPSPVNAQSPATSAQQAAHVSLGDSGITISDPTALEKGIASLLACACIRVYSLQLLCYGLRDRSWRKQL